MYQPGRCPNAEDIMSKLLLVWTGGDPEAHKVSAERLREAVEAVG